MTAHRRGPTRGTMLHYYLVKFKCVPSAAGVLLTPMLLRRGDLTGTGRVFMESTGDWYSFGLARSGELAHRASFSCKTHTGARQSG